MFFPVPTGNTPLEALLEQFSKYNSWDRGFRNDSTFKFGIKANEQGFSEMETAAFCISKFSAPDFDAQEISTAIASAFKENREFGQYRGDNSDNSDNGAPMPNLSPSSEFQGQEEEDLDSYLDKSEELTSNTPLIPDEVYQTLPRRVLRMCEQANNRRERDILLLSILTVLSGCLPMVSGRYYTGRFSPHLYFWLLAEASAGKGVMSHIRHLASAIHNREIADYKKAKKKYDIEHDQWQNQKEAAYHNESIDCSFRSHGEPIHIEHPQLAMVLSGTPAQLGSLITDKGDGFFSRLTLMTFHAKPEWRDVEPDYDSISSEDFFKAEDKNPAKVVYCTDDDFNTALAIVECCIEHSYLLSTSLPQTPTGTIPMTEPRPAVKLLNELKDIFTTKEAVAAGAKLGMSKRKVLRLLKSAINIYITKVEKGVYRKIR
jgi:hypothetical protein